MNSTNPERDRLVVLTCEHAVGRIPEAWAERLRIPASVLRSHRGWDAGAAELARLIREAVPGKPSPVFEGEASRLLVDLNRSVGHPRLWSQWSRRLADAEREEILGQWYRPWRKQVEESIRSLLGHRGVVLHYSVHSFTPVRGGLRRPTDIGILYDPSRPLEAALARTCIGELRHTFPRLKIHANRPYRGTSDGHTTALRRIFSARQYAGLEIELNQGLLRRKADAAQDFLAAVAGAIAKARR